MNGCRHAGRACGKRMAGFQGACVSGCCGRHVRASPAFYDGRAHAPCVHARRSTHLLRDSHQSMVPVGGETLDAV
eukprot:31182-Chlamydomonas_euryale.AAC.2